MLPFVGRNMPINNESNVDFPLPDSPTTPRYSPFFTVKEMLFKAYASLLS